MGFENDVIAKYLSTNVESEIDRIKTSKEITQNSLLVRQKTIKTSEIRRILLTNHWARSIIANV